MTGRRPGREVHVPDVHARRERGREARARRARASVRHVAHEHEHRLRRGGEVVPVDAPSTGATATGSSGGTHSVIAARASGLAAASSSATTTRRDPEPRQPRLEDLAVEEPVVDADERDHGRRRRAFRGSSARAARRSSLARVMFFWPWRGDELARAPRA